MMSAASHENGRENGRTESAIKCPCMDSASGGIMDQDV